MGPDILPLPPRGLARMLGWRRVVVALGASALLGLILSPGFIIPISEVIAREMVVGLVALLAFGLFERWPGRLPPWLARWVLQVLGVALAVPLGVLVVYLVIAHGDPAPFWRNKTRLNGVLMLSVSGLLVAPWIAVAALMRQISGEARRQALAFELERSELERQALDARLRLLQAQVEPHFLFNTLANVRELVDTGSSQASAVLGSLIAYLRAAVPRLQEPTATLGQEFELVRAYLEVMHMRMPDRLVFSLHAEEESLTVYCPPMTLLTLVENAVRHGLNPSEEGGRIEVGASIREGLCRVEVLDTGVGLDPVGEGSGTGLFNLRERLRLAFGDQAGIRLLPIEPHGVRAEMVFPAIGSAV